MIDIREANSAKAVTIMQIAPASSFPDAKVSRNTLKKGRVQIALHNINVGKVGNDNDTP